MKPGDTVWITPWHPPHSTLPPHPDILGMVVDVRPDWYGGSSLIMYGRPASGRKSIGYDVHPKRADVLVLTSEDGAVCLSWYDGARVKPVQTDVGVVY